MNDLTRRLNKIIDESTREAKARIDHAHKPAPVTPIPVDVVSFPFLLCTVDADGLPDHLIMGGDRELIERAFRQLAMKSKSRLAVMELTLNREYTEVAK